MQIEQSAQQVPQMADRIAALESALKVAEEALQAFADGVLVSASWTQDGKSCQFHVKDTANKALAQIAALKWKE